VIVAPQENATCNNISAILGKIVLKQKNIAKEMKNGLRIMF